jgi:predicted nucleic acid-binding protein
MEHYWHDCLFSDMSSAHADAVSKEEEEEDSSPLATTQLVKARGHTCVLAAQQVLEHIRAVLQHRLGCVGHPILQISNT